MGVSYIENKHSAYLLVTKFKMVNEPLRNLRKVYLQIFFNMGVNVPLRNLPCREYLLVINSQLF